MRVLVTGDRGYIGQVLVPVFRTAGHEIVGLDANWYAGCDFGPQSSGYEQRVGDIRNVDPSIARGFRCDRAPRGDLERPRGSPEP